MTRPKKTFAEFREAHDPTYQIARPDTYRRDLPKNTQRFIVACAQNATPIHAGFWAVLQNMATVLRAELLVVPIRYKNPTSIWSGAQSGVEWWAPETRPFLWNAKTQLHAHLSLLADVRVQPTAAAPLTGMEGLSGPHCAIVAHPKLQTRSIAVPEASMAKFLMTTGCCTVANYTDSRNGRLADFHHSLSAVLVELNGSLFHARRLHYTDRTKRVIDLNVAYYANKVEAAPRALAVVMGDTHVDYVDPEVVEATFGADGLVPLVRPEYLVWHDVLDGYSVNPHHKWNPFNKVAKEKADLSARAEVGRAIAFVKKHTPDNTSSVVVASNHNDFLSRWINSNDWRESPKDAEFYLETALAMTRDTRLTGRGTEYPEPFAYWFEQTTRGDKRFKCLGRNESFALADVEMGMHGDLGPNGARGSIKNLRRMGTKSIIGHSHTPGEDEACTQVGTSTRLRLEYNDGPSSWLNAHCVLNADGKRQLILIIDGQFRKPAA